MKTIALLFFVVIVPVIFLLSCHGRAGTPKVLVFTKTAGYHHASIADGIIAIQKLGRQNNFEVDTTSSATWIQEDTLKKYAAIIFLNTTGDLLNNYQEADFERFIQAGGGFPGAHAQHASGCLVSLLRWRPRLVYCIGTYRSFLYRFILFGTSPGRHTICNRWK